MSGERRREREDLSRRGGWQDRTGRGNYGQGLDRALVGLPNVELVALADADATGREQALARTGAARGYADYHELLEREHPDIVAIAPRQPDQREAMLLATIRA